MEGESTVAAPLAANRKRPLNVFHTAIHDRNIGSVKLLIDTVLPVRYSDDFYKKLLQTPYDFSKMGAWRWEQAGPCGEQAR